MIYDIGQVGSVKKTLFEGDTSLDTSKTYSLSETLNNFDFIYVEYKSSAKNITTQYFEPSALTRVDRVLSTFSFNMQDSSPFNCYLYEHQALFNTDLTSFTIAHCNMVRISSGSSWYTPTQDSKDIGILKIIGVKL